MWIAWCPSYYFLKLDAFEPEFKALHRGHQRRVFQMIWSKRYQSMNQDDQNLKFAVIFIQNQKLLDYICAQL